MTEDNAKNKLTLSGKSTLTLKLGDKAKAVNNEGKKVVQVEVRKKRVINPAGASAEPKVKIDDATAAKLRLIAEAKEHEARRRQEEEEKAAARQKQQEEDKRRRDEEAKALAAAKEASGLILTLANAGVKTIDDLGDLATDELIEILGENTVSVVEANKIIMAAREHWFENEEQAGESVEQ